MNINAGILKFKKPDQFPIDEILNESDRIVRGWASVEDIDTDGEIIPVKDLRRTLNTWMKRGAFISDTHSNRIIGKGLRWFEAEHPKTEKPGIVIDYQIFDDYTVDHEAWKEIKDGTRTGLSFGGRATGKPKLVKDENTGEEASELSGMETYEMASVADPANQHAENFMVNYLAKAYKGEKPEKIEAEGLKLLEDFEKGYTVKDTTKPFAGFKDFDECKDSQMERGHSDESSNRICGWLQHKFEGNKAVTDHAHQTTEKNDDVENKLKGENMDGKKKEETNETHEPSKQEEKPENEEDEKKMQTLEKKVDKILTWIDSQKKEEDEDDEDENKKQEPEDENEKPDEAMDDKKQDEEDEDEKKQSPLGGKEILPKATAGETDETASPEGDKVQIMEKKIEEIVDKQLAEKIKKMGIKKVETAKTPRPGIETNKNKVPKQQTDLAEEMLEKARKGQLNPADMNRMTKQAVKKNRRAHLKEALNKEDV